MTNFISQKVKVSPGIHIDLETKVMRLHTIWVEKISSFLLNKYAVHGF